MSAPLLLKGFEVELYTGRADGTVVGCSAEAAAALDSMSPRQLRVRISVLWAAGGWLPRMSVPLPLT